MHCFEGHHVTTLGEITSKDGNRTEIQELDSISHVFHNGKSTGVGLAFVNDIQNGIKLSNLRLVTIFAGDLHQCGHMVALKVMLSQKTSTLAIYVEATFMKNRQKVKGFFF